MTDQEFVKVIHREIHEKIKEGEIESLNNIVNEIGQEIQKKMVEFNIAMDDLTEDLEYCKSRAEKLGAEDLVNKIRKIIELAITNSVPIGATIEIDRLTKK